MRRLLFCLVLLGFSGCALVDQTWFTTPPPAPAPGPVVEAPRLEKRAALIVIAFTTPTPDYAATLASAVRAAEASRPSIGYDVIGMAAAAGMPAVQAAAEREAAVNATTTMRAILTDGVPASRIRLGVRTEPGLTVPQVRVFVR